MTRSRFFRVGSLAVFGLCLAWVAFVHITFAVTGDGDVSERWIAPLRGTSAVYPAVALLFFQYFFVALGFFLGVLALRPWPRSPTRLGLLCGLLVGLWSNAEFLLIAYCGAYTSLPGLILGSVLSGGENTGPWYYVPVLITNVLTWPLLGSCLGAIAGHGRRRSNTGRA